MVPSPLLKWWWRMAGRMNETEEWKGSVCCLVVLMIPSLTTGYQSGPVWNNCRKYWQGRKVLSSVLTTLILHLSLGGCLYTTSTTLYILQLVRTEHVRKSDPESKSEVRVQSFVSEFYSNNFPYLSMAVVCPCLVPDLRPCPRSLANWF